MTVIVIVFFRSSVVFVTSWYTVIFIFGLFALLSQQLVFVSFNLTGDEFRRSSRKKPFWEVLWSHRYNRGFIRNWIEFLFPPDVRSIAEEVVQRDMRGIYIWLKNRQPIDAEKMNASFYFFILFMNALCKITPSLVVCLFFCSNHV